MAFIPRDSRIQIAKPCPYAEHKNNVLRLESKAILEAVTHVKKNHKTLDRIDIFSDSEHALTQLQLLQNGEKLLPSDDNGGLGERILKEINVNDWCTKVHMHKVKAHSGVKGNKIADSFAKAGAKEATRVDPRLLPKWAPDNRNDEEIYSSKSFSSYNKKIARVSHLPSPASSKVHSSYPATKRPSVSPSPFADGRNVDSANRSTKCTRRFP